jgi:hypothetical protein
MTIHNLVSALNGTDGSNAGVRASDAGGIVLIQNVTATQNGVGLLTSSGRQIASLGNAYIPGSALGEGLPTSFIPQH